MEKKGLEIPPFGFAQGRLFARNDSREGIHNPLDIASEDRQHGDIRPPIPQSLSLQQAPRLRQSPSRLHSTIMKRTLILLSAIVLFSSRTTWADPAQLQVKRDDTTVLTLRFGENSLRLFSEVPSQLTAVLREHGIDCCKSQMRISETAWKCCKGKFSIISFDARIQSALEAAFKGPKVAQR